METLHRTIFCLFLVFAFLCLSAQFVFWGERIQQRKDNKQLFFLQESVDVLSRQISPDAKAHYQAGWDSCMEQF